MLRLADLQQEGATVQHPDRQLQEPRVHQHLHSLDHDHSGAGVRKVPDCQNFREDGRGFRHQVGFKLVNGLQDLPPRPRLLHPPDQPQQHPGPEHPPGADRQQHELQLQRDAVHPGGGEHAAGQG